MSAATTQGFVAFVEDVAERAVKTFTQTLALFLVAGVSIVSVAWSTALQSAALATLATVLLALVDSRLVSANPFVEALIRAGRTFIATVVGAVPVVVSADQAVTFADVNWTQVAGFAATAALISLVTSIASLPIGPKGTPSLVVAGEVVAVRDEPIA
ncbi:holin [Gordonia phage PCoral7]|uniref:Holin n=1 Tax=Gordonia phage Toast TaxID=2599852 RepID=A0A5J6TCF9_9CAUD|nr:holin [Gordonia phage Toast]QFG08084.1 holin [Gordonia phage Toast]UVF60531.1 holin [Gordonia phage PCoral7]